MLIYIYGQLEGIAYTSYWQVNDYRCIIEEEPYIQLGITDNIYIIYVST